jgi:hypothetical protein
VGKRKGYMFRHGKRDETTAMGLIKLNGVGFRISTFLVLGSRFIPADPPQLGFDLLDAGQAGVEWLGEGARRRYRYAGASKGREGTQSLET